VSAWNKVDHAAARNALARDSDRWLAQHYHSVLSDCLDEIERLHAMLAAQEQVGAQLVERYASLCERADALLEYISHHLSYDPGDDGCEIYSSGRCTCGKSAAQDAYLEERRK
jgi:hypothetical protein